MQTTADRHVHEESVRERSEGQRSCVREGLLNLGRRKGTFGRWYQAHRGGQSTPEVEGRFRDLWQTRTWLHKKRQEQKEVMCRSTKDKHNTLHLPLHICSLYLYTPLVFS